MRFCPRCGSRYEHERFCPEDGNATEPLPDGVGVQRDPLLGTIVDGRYRIDERIGEGGMGVVYRAMHVTLNKTLALKVLRGEMAKDAEVVQRFIQEAQAATSIGHENIIDISDFGRLPDGTVYFVMEYLDGKPLNELIRRGGSIPVRDAVEILRQIASALGAAHQRGIVHRDLKPDNVYVVARGESPNFVKVLDFGIAKVGGASNKLTRTGMVFGTPHYMSPEQAAGQSVDARTDVYALGVMMYEMFTGRVPFDADTFMAVLTKHMFEKPEPMTDPEAGRQLGALEQITMRALEKKPEHRYQTMAELIEDLDRFSGGRQLLNAPGQRPSSALADALEPRTHSEMRLQDQLSGRRKRAKASWLGLAGIGCAVLAVGLWWLGRGEGDQGATLVPSPASPPALASPDPVPLPPAAPSSPAPGSAQPPPLVVVHIASQPNGAAMVVDGAIVGRTPAAFPRPEEGERHVELRLDGYERAHVRVGPVGPEELRVVLKKRSRQASPKPHAKKPAPARLSKPRRRIQSEVVDPWAD